MVLVDTAHISRQFSVVWKTRSPRRRGAAFGVRRPVLSEAEGHIAALYCPLSLWKRVGVREILTIKDLTPMHLQ
jgi:hypothetical protein